LRPRTGYSLRDAASIAVGGAMSDGPNIDDLYRQAARQADLIAHAARPMSFQPNNRLRLLVIDSRPR
jgi:hypothetical protein